MCPEVFAKCSIPFRWLNRGIMVSQALKVRRDLGTSEIRMISQNGGQGVESRLDFQGCLAASLVAFVRSAEIQS